MTIKYELDRREIVPALIGNPDDFLFITGLGGTSRDISALTKDGPNLYALGGAMGAALSTGLGLALAQPTRQVMVVTGDGELLMGMGTLATIAVLNPPNLSVLCVDNGHYLETGGQVAHTGRGTDLEMIARGAGFNKTAVVSKQSEMSHGQAVLHDKDDVSFVLVRVRPTEPPIFKRNMDASQARLRMKAFLT